jgi:NAD(P)-dependent dehydrogenase (short-subunit alcohol dehydrogenase family)
VTTVLVTGANQGLGFALAGGVARRLGAEANAFLTGSPSGRRILPATASYSSTVG